MSHSSVEPAVSSSPSDGAERTNPTHLMPVLFRDGIDRRTSARVPVRGAVRMGPPNGEPYASVSAGNLSMNGLFIDADRPVRVGARFSAEIPIADDETIYVPEAEVVYYREHEHGSGFGVRLIEPSTEVLEKIAQEIQRATEPGGAGQEASSSSGREPGGAQDARRASPKPRAASPDSSEMATMLPAASQPPTSVKPRSREITDPELDLSSFPEPVFPDRLDSGRPEIMRPVPPRPGRSRFFRWEEVMDRAQQTRQKMLEGARRFPRIWTVMAAAGVALVAVALGVALYKGTRAEAVERAPDPTSRGMTATTQEVLMGERQINAAVEPPSKPEASREAAPSPATPKKPLPPLVMVDELEPPPAHVVKMEPDDAGPTPKKKEHAEKKKRATTVAETKHSAPAAASKSQAKPERVEKRSNDLVLTSAMARLTRTPQPAHTPKAPKQSRLKIGLGPHAKVMKTHVLKSPNRFVIDLEGQDASPTFPTASSPIERIRFGKHADFGRIVIETKVPIEHGLLAKDHRDLRVTLDFSQDR